jgi:hypothetical protein
MGDIVSEDKSGSLFKKIKESSRITFWLAFIVFWGFSTFYLWLISSVIFHIGWNSEKIGSLAQLVEATLASASIFGVSLAMLLFARKSTELSKEVSDNEITKDINSKLNEINKFFFNYSNSIEELFNIINSIYMKPEEAINQLCTENVNNVSDLLDEKILKSLKKVISSINEIYSHPPSAYLAMKKDSEINSKIINKIGQRVVDFATIKENINEIIPVYDLEKEKRRDSLRKKIRTIKVVRNKKRNKKNQDIAKDNDEIKALANLGLIGTILDINEDPDDLYKFFHLMNMFPTYKDLVCLADIYPNKRDEVKKIIQNSFLYKVIEKYETNPNREPDLKPKESGIIFEKKPYLIADLVWHTYKNVYKYAWGSADSGFYKIFQNYYEVE